ncbi:Os01g0232450 [Oryza sativa Japonica Group]|uniref:Os01g0232450 protein n=2 Tax=Oryza sativa subsp. japonica TaxID=39947 RepID=C7IX65_ORYSJ|nr:hypothetical protein EE612_001270 [Oryza sativa]BAH90974.1 Os01g0232450 [Oryza sativa Japonica Group]BAS71186.1 Os01g0232450 [Oryza sativa Japonica Group]|eukprot:NP_001172244.1 Os01g0232450 [Oryza sativa Japonica Group]
MEALPMPTTSLSSLRKDFLSSLDGSKLVFPKPCMRLPRPSVATAGLGSSVEKIAAMASFAVSRTALLRESPFKGSGCPL